MRLTNLFDRDQAFKYVVTFVFAIFFLVVVSILSFNLAGFYDQLDSLSDSVRRGDFEGVELQLNEVSEFYQTSEGQGLQWLADTYLFKDSLIRQASYSYLTKDYETVVNELANEVDDFRTSFLLANAKFQLARQRYRAISSEDPEGDFLKESIIQEVLDDINPDYERALRSDNTDRFNYKWNYDLTSDVAAIRRALEMPSDDEPPPELERIKGEATPTRRRRG